MNCYEKGFIVGLIEGEGCISLVQSWKTKDGRISRMPEIQIKNNSRELLEAAKAILVIGSIYPRKSKNPKWARSYEYHIRGMKRVLPILKEILPFLICKRKAAELVIEWCESRLQRGAKLGAHLPCNQRELEISELLKIRK